MRRLMTAVVAVLLACGPALAGDGEQRVYGPDGRYEGRSSVDRANPDQRSVYDEHGRYQGRIMTDPATGETRAYDEHGKYLGRASGGQLPKSKQ